MRKAIFMLLLVLVSNSKVAHAKELVQSKNSTTRPSAHEQAPFNTKTTSIPKRFIGHDAQRIASTLLSKPTKNEFETSNAFSERLTKWSQIPLYDSVHIDDYLAFPTLKVIAFKHEYDADKEIMRIEFNSSFSNIVSKLGGYGSPYLSRSFKTTNLAPRIGTTMMGVSFKYSRSNSVDFGVELDNMSMYSQWEFNLPIEIAKKFDYLSVLFIGKLDPSDPLFNDSFHSSPRLDERSEINAVVLGIKLDVTNIWLYNSQTGEVVLKLTPDGKVEKQDQTQEHSSVELMHSNEASNLNSDNSLSPLVAPPTQTIEKSNSANYQVPEMIVIPGRGYEIGKYEVTQAEWKSVMGNNPFNFQGNEALPVEGVSWDSIQEYLNRLNNNTGKHFRLPTEAEWEFACLAGKETRYCGSDDVDSVAWNYNNNGHSFFKPNAGHPYPVGRKMPNQFGLYDMTGNVWEWTNDCPDGECTRRILRGGSWNLEPENIDAKAREVSGVAGYTNFLGFRLARTVE